MGLSTYFNGKLHRTTIEEFAKVLSVVSGNYYLPYPVDEKSDNPTEYQLLKNGQYAWITIQRKPEPHYDDEYNDGYYLTIFDSVDCSLNGQFENYFSNLEETIRIMGYGSYSISSEYGTKYDKNETFEQSGIIFPYACAYEDCLRNGVLRLCASVMPTTFMSEKDQYWLDNTLDAELKEGVRQKYEKNEKTIKPYIKKDEISYYFRIRMNILLFISWAFTELKYKSLQDFNHFGQKEATAYRAFLKKNTSYLHIESHHYEKGLGYFLKSVKKK